jgi:alpha-glucosidase
MSISRCFFLLALTAAASGAATVTSPDGQVRFTVAASPEGRLSYSVTMRGQPVIETSPLGIVVDGVNLGEKAALGRSERYSTNQTYPLYGAWSPAADRSNGARIALKHNPSGAGYTLDVRAYNDGVAFRFVVPGAAGTSRVPDEATAFRLPAGSTVWVHDFEGHYEDTHEKKNVEQVAAGEWVAPPLTFRLPGNAGYGSITEAALYRYAGLGLQGDGKRGFDARLGHAQPPSYPFRLRYKGEEERMARPAPVAGALTTPWRVIMTAPDLNALVNCSIVTDVSPPPDAKLFPKGLNTDWIKPGRAVWKYLDGGGDNTLETMKEFSRLASELGFEYHVVEGFWSRWSEKDLKELVDYSRQRGVGIILWKHSRDMRDPEKRRAFFELCRRNGVAGSKLDFFDHEAKEVVELYETCLREAAEHRQVVNFHGANKPTGEARTWPNELTREAIRGMESRKTQRAPHDATLPFTRMLAGHADYTPTVFGERRNDTTWAHQIATAAIFTSPLLVYGAHPKSLLENPAVEVIKAIPSVWDETRVLPMSEIGQVAALARRRGRDWFVAIVNGTDARTIDVPLTFLGAGRYSGTLVRDSREKPDAVEMEKGTFSRPDSIKVSLQPGGGFVARMSQSASLP